MRHYLVLVNIILTLFISCKKEVKQEGLIVEQKQKTSFFKDVLKGKYSDKKLIKQIDFENQGKQLTSLFLLKKEGEMGSSGFLKELDVLIYENKNLVDKYYFKNESPLCDLKVLTEEIKILNQDKNQVLFFPIIHSCEGEEPDLLVANVWDSKKKDYKIEIPVYFRDEETKTDFIQSLAVVDFKSDKVKQNVYNLISKITKIDLSNVKANPKSDKNNPKCFTKSDVSKITSFLSTPFKKEFLKHFDKKEDINLEFIIDYLKSQDCLNKNISINKIDNCVDELKCEVYCSYNITQEEKDDGELSEQTLYIYFNKKNGIISLNKLESEGR